MTAEPRVLPVNEIGEYIRHHSCDRRFKLAFNNRQAARSLPFANRLFNSIDPVLQESGRKREDEWEQSLRDAGFTDLTPFGSSNKSISWRDFAESLGQLGVGEFAFGREISIEANWGDFQLRGRMDFVLVRWERSTPSLWIVEAKASRRDRTYHRIQVTLYRMLVRLLLEAIPVNIATETLNPDNIECVVVRIDETTNKPQAILDLAPLGSLEREEADVRRLLDRDGPFARIIATDLDALAYQLDAKCDDCVFNTHCFPETARQRRIEMVGVEPAVVRTLQSAGIRTLDELAEIDLTGAQARQIRANDGFTENLERLRQLAHARRSTLPRGDVEDPDNYPVESILHSGAGQLPPHEIAGQRLVRIYLSVDYDYIDNRLVGLTAHVTTSEGELQTTSYNDASGSWRRDPVVTERIVTGEDADGNNIYGKQPLSGRDVTQSINSPWTGDYNTDTGSEGQMIQGFFHELVETIAQVTQADEAPIHFYVWSRGEMKNLIEACSRVDTRLLYHLRQLLGCRESLDQLIYSSLEDEVTQRYALGWTSKGLAVVSSLTWFGQRYHWTRAIRGQNVEIDRVFTQDIFDFKTDLDLRIDGEWAANEAETASRHKFEIRSRFHDGLSAPYWRAHWRTLPPPEQVRDPQVRAAIKRYRQSARPLYLKAYLCARVHALRWVEERIRFKNDEINKPAVTIEDLPDFDLNVATTAQAAIDFLILDCHVKATDWIAEHLVPPVNRVPTGRTLPVSNVHPHGADVVATIDLTGYDLDLAAVNSRCTLREGSFVRLTPCFNDPHRTQTLRMLYHGGLNCTILGIDWNSGLVRLSAVGGPNSDRYVFPSYNPQNVDFPFATIDEGVSDFVSGRIERRLSDVTHSPVYTWFDPQSPQIPERAALDDQTLSAFRHLLESFTLSNGNRLAEDQRNAILDGLSTRVQLVQGPPGTGKTMTTAVAVLTRVLMRMQAGGVVYIGANTHTAIDNLLRRISAIVERFRDCASRQQLALPDITVAKLHSSNVQEPLSRLDPNIEDFSAATPTRFISNHLRNNAVLLVGGTSSSLLKMYAELAKKATFQGGLLTPMLIIDEASMMVFPHFLALATLLEPDGEIMLAGDHRQLAPIVAHDWEREDRPPFVVYQPYVSAYQAIQNIAVSHAISEQAIKRSALSLTFRLPAVIRDLIARLYRLDQIELQGIAEETDPAPEPQGVGSWDRIWEGDTGLYLVLHDERTSQFSNETELHIIEAIISAAGTTEEGTVAIVTPHRAQRSLLQTKLEHFQPKPIDIIDTVERLQGGERPTVIMSATVSDPSAIAKRADFILDLNRSNVAFSRSQQRLIVVCAEALINHIPVEMDQYDSAMLWKSLRSICTRQIASETVDGHSVRVFTPGVVT